MAMFARFFLLLFCCSALWMPGAFAYETSSVPVALASCHGDAPQDVPSAAHAACHDCLICAGSCLPMQALPALRDAPLAHVTHFDGPPGWASHIACPEPEPPRS